MDEDDQLESHMFTLDLLLKMLFVTSSFFFKLKKQYFNAQQKRKLKSVSVA